MRNINRRTVWTVVIVLLVLIAGTAVSAFVYRTTSDIREALAEEVLEQQHDVSSLLLDYSALILTVERQRLAPGLLNTYQINYALNAAQIKLESMRSIYSFSRLDGASKAHAYLKPILEDVELWLSEGIPGHQPGDEFVVEMISQRVIDRFPALRLIASETDQVARTLIHAQARDLDRFRNSLITLLGGFALLTLSIAALLTRQRNLQTQLTTEQEFHAQRFKDFADTGADWFWEMDADLSLALVQGSERDADNNSPMANDQLVTESFTGTDWPMQELHSRKPFNDFESAWSSPTGGIRVIAKSGRPIINKRGKFQGYRGVVRDITDRKQMERELESSNRALVALEARGREQAEAALHSSEERFKEFAESAADWFWELGPDFRFSYVAGRFEEILGLTANQILGKTRTDLYAQSPADYDKWETYFKKLSAHQSFTHLEMTWIRADKERRFLSLSGRPRVSREGEFLGYRGVGQNITRRRLAENAVRESERLLRATLNALPSNIAILEHTGRIIAVNNAWRELVGQDRPELVDDAIGNDNFTVCELMADTNISCPGAASDLIREVLSGTRESLYYKFSCNKGPDQRWIVIRMTSFSSGEEQHAVFAWEDVTEQKQLEERDRLLHAELAHVSRLTTVGEMASGLAHELNQPLTAITHNADAARIDISEMHNPDPELVGAIDDIYTQAQRAGAIIRSMRRLATKEGPAATPTDINQLVEDTVRLIGPEAREQDVDVHLQLSNDLPLTLIDSVQIQQVIVNLERNSVEAMGRHSAEARELFITTRCDGDSAIRVTIEDTGPGFDPEIKQHLFTAFSTNKIGGMGLGLSISRSIVEAHGGQLWLDERHASRTIFHFTVPVKHEEEQ